MKEFDKLAKLAIAVLDTEARAISDLRERIDEDFHRACRLLGECAGRIIVTGIGKSGHIANKITSTLASTGSAAFYVHPAEAGHGDLGMIGDGDVILALSHSGETDEINALLPALKRLRTPLIALTGNCDSTLGRAADVCLNTAVREEACPLGLAPTASTAAALAMGDALAVALMSDAGFTAEDFARSHPGGHLGRRLLLRVGDLMRTGDALPKVAPGTPLTDALYEMSRKGLGMTLVVDAAGAVRGLFTDGDLRRALDDGIDVASAVIDDVMTREFHSIGGDRLAVEALNLMETKLINSMPVLDERRALIGALNVHDLLRAGL